MGAVTLSTLCSQLIKCPARLKTKVMDFPTMHISMPEYENKQALFL